MTRFVLLLATCAALSGVIVGCASSPARPPQAPAGYEADTTPGRDGSEWIGGAR